MDKGHVKPSVVDTRVELSELVKRRSEISVRFQALASLALAVIRGEMAESTRNRLKLNPLCKN